MIDFDAIKPETLSLVLKKGSLVDLPEEYQEYYSLMELVRGLRAKNSLNGKIITKSSIIKLVKTEYSLSDYQARRLYEDSINFFYSQDNVKKEAFSNLYADQLDNAAALALEMGQFDNYHRLKKEAASLRGLYDKKADEIPAELYRKQIVIYTTESTDLGLEPEDTKELEQLLDTIPDVPTIKMNRVKSEANIPGHSFDILKMLAEDVEEYTENENKINSKRHNRSTLNEQTESSL